MQIELLPASPDDAALIFNAWGYNPQNFTYLSAVPQTCIADAQAYLNKAFANPDNLVLHIRAVESRKIVGLIKTKVEGPSALIGYVLDKAYWGRGIATQALEQLLPMILRNNSTSRIWATCATDNPGSARVLEKCGFVCEGVLRDWIVYPVQGNAAHDNFSYVLSLPA